MDFVLIKIGHALILYYAKRHVLQFCSTCLLLFLIISMPSVLTSISSHPWGGLFQPLFSFEVWDKFTWYDPKNVNRWSARAGSSLISSSSSEASKAEISLSNGSEVSIGCSDAITTRCTSCIESESPAPQFEQNLAWSGILVPQFLQYIIYISLPEILSLGKENSHGEFSRSSSRSFQHRYKSERDCL